MAYRTFNEWNARGRIIKKGEKAMGHLLDGTALFGKEQIKGKKSRDWWETSLDDGPDSWYMGDEGDYY